jgi:PEGA domain-containing protein
VQRCGDAVSRARRSSVAPALAALVLVLVAGAGAAHATEPVAFVWWGEPDPSGVDQAFLALARRRGAPAVRETPGKPADEPLSARLAQAIALQQSLDFKSAIAAFDEVEREAVARGGGTLSEGELTDLYAHRAGAHAALGDEADSWNDLVEAVALAPGRPLDPARFPPRLVEAARRARESLSPPATLVVTAQPPDAVIIVDGQLYGKGRVEVPRPAGRHFVRAERAGFVAAGRIVESGTGSTEAKLSLTPAATPSALELARRGSLANGARTVGAFIGGGQRAVLTLLYVDASGRTLGKSTLPVDDQLTSGALAAAVDGLVGGVAGETVARAPRPWWRRPWVWAVAGGVTAAALGVGLGVGLTAHDGGVPTRVDLGPAR